MFEGLISRVGAEVGVRMISDAGESKETMMRRRGRQAG